MTLDEESGLESRVPGGGSRGSGGSAAGRCPRPAAAGRPARPAPLSAATWRRSPPGLSAWRSCRRPASLAWCHTATCGILRVFRQGMPSGFSVAGAVGVRFPGICMTHCPAFVVSCDELEMRLDSTPDDPARPFATNHTYMFRRECSIRVRSMRKLPVSTNQLQLLQYVRRYKQNLASGITRRLRVEVQMRQRATDASLREGRQCNAMGKGGGAYREPSWYPLGA